VEEKKAETAALQRYLIFSLGSEHYGTAIGKVREIIRFESLTPIHDSQDYIRGVINLRGKIIPILDLRIKFGMEPKEYTDKTVFVMLDINGEKEMFNMGVAVDAVHEVAAIKVDAIEEPPQVGMKAKNSYLEGIVQLKERMVMLLDMDRIITADEIISISGTA
jgi:purine-binding chemotaxis protein CheW